jgi:2'-hydroxyisoflavone reductase
MPGKHVDALRRCVGRYVFVSTISVYADQSVVQTEDAPLAALHDPNDDSPQSYGARKAACDQIVERGFVKRATIESSLRETPMIRCIHRRPRPR